MTAREMVDLAGKPINELLTIFSERSGVQLTTDQREAFFQMKSQYYLDHEAEVSLSLHHLHDDYGLHCTTSHDNCTDKGRGQHSHAPAAVYGQRLRGLCVQR